MRPPTATRPPQVLHVVHRLGSGVEMVLLDYVRATPEIDHHLAYSADPACHDPRLPTLVPWASTEELSSAPIAFARGVRRARARVTPDLVHAHSSVGGAVARAVCFGVPLVYTPHCFAFLRRDVARPARSLFWLAEAALARHTTAYAACSLHEAQLAERFHSGRPVDYVPNIASPEPVAAHGGTGQTEGTSAERAFTVVASGRIGPQKDPATFAALARALDRDRDHEQDQDQARRPVRCVWIGSGGSEETRALEASGVEVTGWLDRPQALAVLGDADLYVHTALWEATPLTILEAAALDVPVLARHTAPIAAMGLSGTWHTTAELVSAVRDVLISEGSGPLSELRESNRRLRAHHHPDRLQTALRSCYARAGGQTFRSAPGPDPDRSQGSAA